MSCFMQIATPTPPSHLPPNSNSNNPNLQLRKQTISRLQKCRNINQITQIQAHIIKNNQSHDFFVVFELLRVCSKRNAIDHALKIFDKTRNPNVYLYTAIIDGLVLSGSYHNAIAMYSQMIENSILPDNFVVNSVLKACRLVSESNIGKQIHSQVLKLGLCSNRQILLNFIEFYGKCGEFESMIKVFDEMPERDTVAMTVMMSSYFDHGFIGKGCDVFDLVKDKDTVCWTAMIDGLVRNGEMSKALECFRRMQREGVKGNEFTVVCVLSACAQLGALEIGKWVHSYMKKHDVEVNHFVGSALNSMYSRCGSIEEAERVFEGMRMREVSTYNSMIVGFALNGKSVEAVETFRRMIDEGMKPNNVTFVGVLNACCHGGLVEFGLEIFRSMQVDYGVEPQIEHYGCVVDLLGRVGRVEEAYRFIQNMRVVEPDYIIWGSLLSACKVHQNFELGDRVVEILLNHESCDPGTYVLISNFYASRGKWEEALQARAKLKENGQQKEPGCSSIEINNEIHEFLLGDIRHPQRKAIYRKLEEMESELRLLEGYSPEVGVVSQDITGEEKERALAIHSERLAISYGLISTEPYTSLRVVKNLRVCDDCHTTIKLISKITRRKIVMRDRNRFHHFENGSCSCCDYW